MKKCYFTTIDDNFDPAKDLVLGPWCFPTIGHLESITLVEPYMQDEILTLHKKLFDLALFLLRRDIEKINLDDKSKYFLALQKDYLFFVFFAFSRYRAMKKILKENSIHEFSFEYVEQPKEKCTSFPYFKSDSSGYLAFKILMCLVGNSNFHFFENTNKKHNEQKINSNDQFSRHHYFNIKKRLNYFNDVNGIRFLNGLFLSAMFFFLNFTRKKVPENILYNKGKKDCPEEFLDFIKIFDKISCFFIKKSLCDFNFEEKVPMLSIKSPSFFNNSLEFSKLINASLVGKTKLLISQHGSHYATMQKHFHREIEYDTARFISWGKETTSYLERKNVINCLPNPYLSIIANKYKFDNQKTILWITGVHYKAGDGLEYVYGTRSAEYMKNKVFFHACLDEKIKEFVIYKSLDSCSEMFPDIVKDIMPKNQQVISGNIISLMSNARVVFLDYYGTPFYEAMSMNTPVILCFLEEIPFFSTSAEKLFKRFEKAGIIYRTAEAAASFINKLYSSDIKKWWLNESIQNIRRDFLEMYANNRNYFLPWVKAVWNREI